MTKRDSIDEVLEMIEKRAKRNTAIKDNISKKKTVNEFIKDFINDIEEARLTDDLSEFVSMKKRATNKLSRRLKEEDKGAMVEIVWFTSGDDHIVVKDTTVDRVIITWSKSYASNKGISEIQVIDIMDLLLRDSI